LSVMLEGNSAGGLIDLANLDGLGTNIDTDKFSWFRKAHQIGSAALLELVHLQPYFDHFVGIKAIHMPRKYI